MAAKVKAKSKQAKKQSTTAKTTEKSLKDVAGGFVDEVEQTGADLIEQVKQLFDGLGDKVSDVAGAAVGTTAAVAQKVGKEPVHYLGALLKEIQEAGEASIKVIGDGFEALRDLVVKHAEPQPAGKSKKKASTKAKKKASKKVAKKKAAKKKVAKKKVVKKKAAKKTASKKTVKKRALKKAPAKKAAKKKAVGRKKSAVKKGT